MGTLVGGVGLVGARAPTSARRPSTRWRGARRRWVPTPTAAATSNASSRSNG